MLVISDNFWSEGRDVPSAHVITTNGYVTIGGRCVMGRGVAKQAKGMFPGIDQRLGHKINVHGNIVHALGPWVVREHTYFIYSFPVKHNWWEQADLELIETSCQQLVEKAQHWGKVVMVRPGCGNGGLDWVNVEPVCQRYFDDRFVIVERN